MQLGFINVNRINTVILLIVNKINTKMYAWGKDFYSLISDTYKESIIRPKSHNRTEEQRQRRYYSNTDDGLSLQKSSLATKIAALCF